jgi:hypothetical protein
LERGRGIEKRKKRHFFHGILTVLAISTSSSPPLKLYAPAIEALKRNLKNPLIKTLILIWGTG